MDSTTRVAVPSVGQELQQVAITDNNQSHHRAIGCRARERPPIRDGVGGTGQRVRGKVCQEMGTARS
jgi:hypothetical protein